MLLINNGGAELVKRITYSPEAFNEDKIINTRYKIAKESGISQPGIRRIFKDPSKFSMLSGEAIYAVLSIGYELNDEEILNMKVGDLFSIVSDTE